MCRIEVYEKYKIKSTGYDADWWAENMPKGSTPPESAAQYGYRRTMPLIDHIERPIELPGNNKECIIRFWSGEDMTILCNYDEFCVRLHDLEEEMMIEREAIMEEISRAQNISDGN